MVCSGSQVISHASSQISLRASEEWGPGCLRTTSKIQLFLCKSVTPQPCAVMAEVIYQGESSQWNETLWEWKIEMKLKLSQYQILHTFFFFCNNTKGRKRIRKWVRGRWKERWSIKQSYFFTLWIYSPDRHLFSKLLIFYIQILWLSVLGPRFVWTDYPLIFTMKLNYPFYVFRYFQLFPELFLETESSWWVSQ